MRKKGQVDLLYSLSRPPLPVSATNTGQCTCYGKTDSQNSSSSCLRTVGLHRTQWKPTLCPWFRGQLGYGWFFFKSYYPPSKENTAQKNIKWKNSISAYFVFMSTHNTDLFNFVIHLGVVLNKVFPRALKSWNLELSQALFWHRWIFDLVQGKVVKRSCMSTCLQSRFSHFYRIVTQIPPAESIRQYWE